MVITGSVQHIQMIMVGTFWVCFGLVFYFYVYCVPCLLLLVLCLRCVLSAPSDVSSIISPHVLIYVSLVPQSVLVGSLFLLCVLFSVSLKSFCLSLSITLDCLFIKHTVFGVHHNHLHGRPAFGSSPHHHRDTYMTNANPFTVHGNYRY